MEITLKFNDDEINKLQGVYDVFNAIKNSIHDDSDYESENNPFETVSQWEHLPSIKELAATEYYQKNQDVAIELIKEDVVTGNLTFNNEKDGLLKNCDPVRVANTLCNVNARLMVANNFLARNNFTTFSFMEGYRKVLKNMGTLPGKLSSCNSDLYRALLFDVIEYKIKSETVSSQFSEFIKRYHNQLIRVWLLANNSKGLGTHATTIWYEYNSDKINIIDTWEVNRSIEIPIEDINNGYLFSRQIDHLETLEYARR
jgi:hypothetical protein